jgi:putative ABC transport system permease protein
LPPQQLRKATATLIPTGEFVQHIWQDIRHAIRTLGKSPGMSAISIVTLAVGIAVVTTIFSFVNSVFYRPLPYPDADRIVALSSSAPRGWWDYSSAPLQIVEQMRHATRSIERVAAFKETYKILALRERARSVGVTAVDSSVLPMIQAHPERGRLITASEIRALTPVALISDSLWRSTFNGNDAILGQTLSLEGVTYTIVGVLPPGYRFYMRSDVLIPLAEHPDSVAASIADRYGLLAKLRPGASLEQARLEVKQLGDRLAAADPQFKRWHNEVYGGMYDRTRGFGAPIYSWLFVGVAMCVLLIACTNVANLMLVRAAERRGEMAIRTSLGASRARLIRLALTESTLLGLAAATLGALLSVWGIRLLFILIPTYGFPSWIHLGVDVRVLGFTLILAVISVAAIGITPALEGTRLDLVKALKVGGDTAVTNSALTRSGRRGVAVEIALSVMLFVGAALLWRSYGNLSSTNLGFPADKLIQPWVTLDQTRFSTDSARLRFQHELAERFTADPRVFSVAIRGNAVRLDVDEPARKAALKGKPDQGWSEDLTGIFLTDDPSKSADRDVRPYVTKWGVSDSYFRTMGLAIVSGRGFAEQDQAGSSPVAVVSEQVARVFWHRPDVVGKTFTAGRGGTPITVVGVARDYKGSFTDPGGMRIGDMPAVYYSERQATPNNVRPIVRARGDASALLRAVPGIVHDVDAQAVIPRVETMEQEEELHGNRMLIRVFGTILGVLAMCALILAAIGTFGVIAYGVALRTREIGLRIALGGTHSQVVGLFVSEGMRSIGVGLVLGVFLALAASQILRRMLVGLSPFDPITYAATLAFFGTVALLACWLPARRAARVEPMVALRGE